MRQNIYCPPRDFSYLRQGWSMPQCLAARTTNQRVAVFRERPAASICCDMYMAIEGGDMELVFYAPIVSQSISKYITNKRGEVTALINGSEDRSKIFFNSDDTVNPVLVVINIDSNLVITMGNIDGWESVSKGEIDIYFQVGKPNINYYDFIVEMNERFSRNQSLQLPDKSDQPAVCGRVDDWLAVVNETKF